MDVEAQNLTTNSKKKLSQRFLLLGAGLTVAAPIMAIFLSYRSFEADNRHHSQTRCEQALTSLGLYADKNGDGILDHTELTSMLGALEYDQRLPKFPIISIYDPSYPPEKDTSALARSGISYRSGRFIYIPVSKAEQLARR